MANKILHKNFTLMGSHTLLIENFIALHDFRVFIMYDFGFWDVFDLRDSKLISKGKINCNEGEDI